MEKLLIRGRKKSGITYMQDAAKLTVKRMIKRFMKKLY